MNYEVRVGGRTFQVEVTGSAVRIDGRAVEATLDGPADTPLRRLVLEGAARTVAVSRTEQSWVVQEGGVAFEVEVTDERTLALRRMVGQRQDRKGGGAVRAPMPGLVLRLEVEEGQQVSAGTGLLVLEAMKMENEIRAPAAGVVRRILVRAGSAVEKGAPLMELE